MFTFTFINANINFLTINSNGEQGLKLDISKALDGLNFKPRLRDPASLPLLSEKASSRNLYPHYHGYLLEFFARADFQCSPSELLGILV